MIGDLTVEEFMNLLKEKDLHLYSISHGAALIYNTIFPKHVNRKKSKLSQLVLQLSKKEFPEWKKHFDIVVACEDAEGKDVDIPLVSIKFKE